MVIDSVMCGKLIKLFYRALFADYWSMSIPIMGIVTAHMSKTYMYDDIGYQETLAGDRIIFLN